MSLLPIINGTKNDRFGIIRKEVEKNTNQEKNTDRNDGRFSFKQLLQEKHSYY